MSLKATIIALAALGAMAGASSASASVLYDSGAPNGSIAGVNIGYGNQVADSFTLTEAATITGIEFASWDYPGSTLTSVGYAIDLTSALPTTLTTASIDSSTFLFTQQPNDYAIDENVFSTTPVTLAAGTYYLALGSALGSGGFWDVNNGSSTSYGPYGQFSQSETFTVLGNTVSAAPEPGTWALMMIGIGGIGLFFREAKRKHGFTFARAMNG